MPKTLQGANKNTFAGQAKVAVNGDDMEALDIEVPVQTLLDDAAYLLAELREVAQALQGHSHSIATADAPGFMSPGDRAAIAGFADALASHRHDNATPQIAGFISSGDKDKLDKIEHGAQVVDSTKVRTALGMLRGRYTIPDGTYGPAEVKTYRRTLQGVTFDHGISASQYSSGDAAFAIYYHAIAGAIEIFVRNNSESKSRTFSPTEVTYTAFEY